MGYSEPIFAADFKDFESYVAAIQREWDAQWKRVSMADWSGANALALPSLCVCRGAGVQGCKIP